MRKILRCGELMEGCPYEATGATEDEVLLQAAAHAQQAHGIESFPPELMAKVRGAIRDAE